MGSLTVSEANSLAFVLAIREEIGALENDALTELSIIIDEAEPIIPMGSVTVLSIVLTKLKYALAEVTCQGEI